MLVRWPTITGYPGPRPAGQPAGGLVSYRDRGIEVPEQFNVAQRQALSDAYERQVRVNRDYLALLCEMRDRLAAEGVPLLLLKGLFLAVRFGGGSDRHFMWDADILVHPEHVRSALHAARGLGLSTVGSRLPISILDRVNLHAIEVSHRGRAIDIHWRFRNRPGYAIDYPSIWSDAQSISIDGEAFRAPADADALLLALLEIAGDMERSHIKLRSLWTIGLMLRELDAQLDWAAFFALRRIEGLLPLTVNMLGFCLAIANSHEGFPRLVMALKELVVTPLIAGRDTALRILARPRQHLANRDLYARLQPRGRLFYWGWWLGSAPLRFALSGNL